jgi:hypothetical protein
MEDRIEMGENGERRVARSAAGMNESRRGTEFSHMITENIPLFTILYWLLLYTRRGGI